MVLPRGRAALVSATVVLAVVVGAFTAVVEIPTGSATQVSRSYSVTRVLRSTVLQRCIDVTARGTLRGTRTDALGSVHWTGVRIADPTIVAVGSTLVDGRCDRARPWRMRADLAQAWTSGGTDVGTRKAAEGPSTNPLRQFNEGSPILVPDAVRLRFPGSASIAVRGVVTVQAHTSGADDLLRFPVEVSLG
jgi:hypothetical protein